MTDSKPPEQHGEQDDQQRHEATEQRNEQGKPEVDIIVLVVVVAVYLIISYVLWRFLNHYIQPGDDPTQKRGLVQALGLILVGLAGAIGIYFTWRSQQHARKAQDENQGNTQAQLKLTRDQLAQAAQAQKDNQENTQKELNLTRQGQMTERFTQAIDQLGNESLAIRLGGIYALERIARESEEDHGPIMEVLTAYVRHHARWPPEVSQQSGEDTAAEKKSKEAATISRQESESRRGSRRSRPAPADIQAIMTIIGRRTGSLGRGEPDFLNLRETNLSGADLRGADLRGAHFIGANLSGANLNGAKLNGAHFIGADLSGADLSVAHCSHAHFSHADLSYANVSYADLSGVSLDGANFSHADLSAAKLNGADLSGADLSGADLSHTGLSYANLSEAGLVGADLSGANLWEARDLQEAQLEEARGDENTVVPGYLEPPEHWGVKAD